MQGRDLLLEQAEDEVAYAFGVRLRTCPNYNQPTDGEFGIVWPDRMLADHTSR